MWTNLLCSLFLLGNLSPLLPLYYIHVHLFLTSSPSNCFSIPAQLCLFDSYAHSAYVDPLHLDHPRSLSVSCPSLYAATVVSLYLLTCLLVSSLLPHGKNESERNSSMVRPLLNLDQSSLLFFRLPLRCSCTLNFSVGAPQATTVN